VKIKHVQFLQEIPAESVRIFQQNISNSEFAHQYPKIFTEENQTIAKTRHFNPLKYKLILLHKQACTNLHTLTC